MKTVSFGAVDTLFFRESRPMESMGELQSVFPPPPRTLAGAIRTLIGETDNVDWRAYETACNNHQPHPLKDKIGYSDDLGPLALQGPWLVWNEERLYPAPLHLLKKDNTLYRLELDTEVTRCDLGEKVRLPKLPNEAARGSKPLEETWLSKAALTTVLLGGDALPSIHDLKTAGLDSAEPLFKAESRLGIARDNTTRAVKKGLLYQTRHIRPEPELSIELDIVGLPKDMPKEAMVRLGGEGRTAAMKLKDDAMALPGSPDMTHASGLLLYLLTPLRVTQSGEEWQPLPDFGREKDEQHQTVWQGELLGVELELQGAVTGKVLREGGWDLAKREPRAVTSLIPAGSVFFCKPVDGDGVKAAKALHGKQIGELTEYGYGQLAVGIWNDKGSK